MSDGAVQRLSFGPFELWCDQRALLRDGEVLPLGGRALDLLIYLVSRPGEVIAKKELIDHVWSNVTVEEGSLRVHVAAIRKTLGDGQFGNRYIANVQGRGYSFVGTVTPLEAGTESSSDAHRRRRQLPARPPRMIGRDPALNAVKEKLLEDRFVTLLGPAGIGKTTLAVAVGHVLAEAFNGEVYFSDLASLTDPDQVASVIGTSLGLTLKSTDSGLDLVDQIRSRKLLVILDSCEHVIEAVASIAEQIYQETAQVHLLTTSCELLRVEGERCYQVPVLDVPPNGLPQTADALLRYPAAQLFVERVAASGVVLADDEAPSVAEMCRKLDGLPLAIELVARQVATRGVRNTAAGLVELLKFSHRTASSPTSDPQGGIGLELRSAVGPRENGFQAHRCLRRSLRLGGCAICCWRIRGRQRRNLRRDRRLDRKVPDHDPAGAGTASVSIAGYDAGICAGEIGRTRRIRSNFSPACAIHCRTT